MFERTKIHTCSKHNYTGTLPCPDCAGPQDEIARLRAVNKQMLEALHEVFEIGVPEKDEKIRAAIKAGGEVDGLCSGRPGRTW